jgi:hypothetical protein
MLGSAEAISSYQLWTATRVSQDWHAEHDYRNIVYACVKNEGHTVASIGDRGEDARSRKYTGCIGYGVDDGDPTLVSSNPNHLGDTEAVIDYDTAEVLGAVWFSYRPNGLMMLFICDDIETSVMLTARIAARHVKDYDDTDCDLSDLILLERPEVVVSYKGIDDYVQNELNKVHFDNVTEWATEFVLETKGHDYVYLKLPDGYVLMPRLTEFVKLGDPQIGKEFTNLRSYARREKRRYLPSELLPSVVSLWAVSNITNGDPYEFLSNVNASTAVFNYPDFHLMRAWTPGQQGS